MWELVINIGIKGCASWSAIGETWDCLFNFSLKINKACEYFCYLVHADRVEGHKCVSLCFWHGVCSIWINVAVIKYPHNKQHRSERVYFSSQVIDHRCGEVSQSLFCYCEETPRPRQPLQMKAFSFGGGFLHFQWVHDPHGWKQIGNGVGAIVENFTS